MRHTNLLAMVLLGSFVLFNPLSYSNTDGNKSNKKFSWPSLPATGFIKGRAATKADVDKRQAVFAYLNGKTKSTPIDIQLPQYGLIKNQQTNKMIPVIVLQAEVVQGQEMIGYIVIANNLRAVTTRKNIKLLGNKCCPKH